MDIFEYLKKKFPNINFDKGTAYYDFVLVLSSLLEPILSKLNEYEDEGFYRINEETIDTVLRNFGLTRQKGLPSRGLVRIWVVEPVDMDLSDAVFYTADLNLKFLPVVKFISKDDFNQDFIGYFYDVPVISEKPGSAYNVSSGTITVFDSPKMYSVIKVENLVDFAFGTDPESAEEAVERAFDSIGVRSFESVRNIQSLIFNYFGDIVDRVQVISYNDPEMDRDILNGVHIGGKIDLYVKDRVLQIDNIILPCSGHLITISSRTVPLEKLPVIIPLKVFVGAAFDHETDFAVFCKEKNKVYNFSLKQEIFISVPDHVTCQFARIQYVTYKSVYFLQKYADANRIVTTDVLVKGFRPALVDIDLGAYSESNINEDFTNFIESELRNFIYKFPFRRNSMSIPESNYYCYLQISDLIAFLYKLGITFIDKLRVNITFYDDQFQIKNDYIDLKTDKQKILIPRTYQLIPNNVYVILSRGL